MIAFSFLDLPCWRNLPVFSLSFLRQYGRRFLVDVAGYRLNYRRWRFFLCITLFPSPPLWKLPADLGHPRFSFLPLHSFNHGTE